jgi:DnaJ-class molecular chaperone
VEITEAYQVLKDSSKRHLYDMYGKKGLDKQNQHGGHPFGDFFDPFGQGGHVCGVVSTLFCVDFGRFFPHQQGGKKTHDAHAEVEVTLEEIYFGTSRDLSIRRNVICSKCRGTGAKGGKTKTCSRCHGRGQIVLFLFLSKKKICFFQKRQLFNK